MIRSCEWYGMRAVEFSKGDYTALLVPETGANLVRLAHTRLGVEAVRTPSRTQIEEFRRRTMVACEEIGKIDYLSVLPPQGSIYLFVNIKRTGIHLFLY